MDTPKLKVNWEGSFFINHSLALVNREICKRLINYNQYEVGLIPYEEDSNFNTDHITVKMKEHYVTEDNSANITIRHQWPPKFNKPNSDKWILFQPWEFGSIPKMWYIPMKDFIDEVWVPSTYNKECYIRSGISEDKIKIVPLGVDENIFNLEVKPIELQTKKTFKFLFVGGTLFRKGIDILLQAYADEFSEADDVCLIVKDFGTNSFYRGLTAEQTIKELQQNKKNPEIIYINQDLPTNDLAGLYKACNCLVHPYRGEGFGLPIIESMACGTPAIVPNLGPVTDFCNEDTTFFVSSQEEISAAKKLGDMETLDHMWWLKIDKADLQQKMRFAYENRNLVNEKGKQASQHILSNFTWNRTAKIVSNQLQQLSNKKDKTEQETINSEIKIKELYHQIAHTFEGSPNAIRYLYKKWTTYFLPGERVLDIGCGNGMFMEMLKEVGVESDGLDFDNQKVTQGRAKGLNIRNQKAEDFLADKTLTYDGIFLGHIIEHIPPKELLNLLLQCTRALKPNGKVIILTPNIAHPPVVENFWLDLTHIRPYPRKLVEVILQGLGLTVKESGYRNNNYDAFVIGQKSAYEMLWQSPIFDSSGYAEEQKTFLDALKPFPLKIKIESSASTKYSHLTNEELQNYLINLQNNVLYNQLIHYQAAPAYQFAASRAPISIGRTMFETDNLPPGWTEKLNALTEVWVPSEFNKETFITAGVEQDKIFIVPSTIDSNKYNPERVTPYPLATANLFNFLSVFDWNKRKGWDVLIRAFIKEFAPKENVCLNLKVTKFLEYNANPHLEIAEQAKELGLTEIPRIQIIDNPFTEEEMVQLYAAADAYVMPSRGEGWGLPYIEAMSMGLPTIGTRWSGQTAFMNDTNSYLIDIEGVVPIPPDIPYFGQFHWHNWAEPSESHLRILMRNVYENIEQAKKVGQKARQDILTHFSKEKAAQQIYKRINELVKHHYS